MAKTRALRPQPTSPPRQRAPESAITESTMEDRLETPQTLHESAPAVAQSDANASLPGADAKIANAKIATANERPRMKEHGGEKAAPQPDVSATRDIQIQIPSSAEYVRVVRLAVLGVASRMPFSYDDVEDIKLAVSEACNNAILHAANEAARTLAANSGQTTATKDAETSDQAGPSGEAASPAPAAIAGDATAKSAGADAANSNAARADKASGVVSTVVLVTMTPWPDRLEITIADEGFVPPPGLSARVPASPRKAPDALRESGLGLFLMQALMDQVEHGTGADSNTVVRLVKYLPRAPAKTS